VLELSPSATSCRRDFGQWSATTDRVESSSELATVTERLAVLAIRQEAGLLVRVAQGADQRRGGLAGLMLIGTIASAAGGPARISTATHPGRASPTATKPTPTTTPCSSHQQQQQHRRPNRHQGSGLAGSRGCRQLRALLWPRSSACWAQPASKSGRLIANLSSKKKGTVLKQSVAEGTKVEPGSRVSLVVAAPLSRVPAVVGQSEASAIRDLKNAAFRVMKTTQTRSTGQDGVVLSQSPSGGTRGKPSQSFAL